MTVKTFPIRATCTECGHSADIFVNDELVHKAMEDHVKDRMMAIWQPLLVKRMFVSWVILFGVGCLFGILVGVWAVRP